MVIMPDANKAQVLGNLVGAGVGAAGQRCMAISVAVFVGSAREWIPELAAEFAKVKPGVWHDPEAAYGPSSARRRKSGWRGLSRRGLPREPSACWTAVLRRPRLPGGQLGGADPVSRRDPEMRIYKEEIFGPVLACLEVGAWMRRLPSSTPTPMATAPPSSPAVAPPPQVSPRGGGGPGGDQRAHPGAAAVLLLYRLARLLLRGSARLRQAGGAFYTETKTVTERWFDEDIPSGPNMTIQLR